MFENSWWCGCIPTTHQHWDAFLPPGGEKCNQEAKIFTIIYSSCITEAWSLVMHCFIILRRFQVTFGQQTNVTAITMQGVPGKGYLRSFRLSYSEDGLFWTWYLPNNPLPPTTADLEGLTKAKRRKKIFLDPVISTQYIRVNPRKWKRRIAMRAEFHGCALYPDID